MAAHQEERVGRGKQKKSLVCSSDTVGEFLTGCAAKYIVSSLLLTAFVS